eukprot:scaffold9972_cov118-Isochrysis_galbana.AAC.3
MDGIDAPQCVVVKQASGGRGARGNYGITGARRDAPCHSIQEKGEDGDPATSVRDGNCDGREEMAQAYRRW